MSMSKAVQFNSVDNILNAYQLRSVAPFSIFCGNQLNFKYEGDSMEEGSTQLENYLQMIAGSAAIYSLCVYEEFDGKINVKTPYHGSFNFRLNNATDFQQVSGIGAIALQLKQMDEKIEKLQRESIADELEGDETPGTETLDMIGSILMHPVVEKLLPVFMSALNIPQLQNQNQLQPAAISGIPAETLPADLLQAVAAMVAAVPESKDALISLGNIAETNPQKFKMILGYMKFI